MKYFIVAGEASGDLHASNLMKELVRIDSSAEFRFFGGDKMASVGGELIKHYKDMAFMGIVDVVMHLRTVLKNISLCKSAVASYKPDVLILVDYADFNLRIAKFVKEKGLDIPVYFYISPKIWAWKEYRIKSFKKYIDKMFVILPFETDFFGKHNFPVEYVGNPSVESVGEFQKKGFDKNKFKEKYNISDEPVVALLPGSREGEIRRNLEIMLSVVTKYNKHKGYQIIVAGGPGLDESYYKSFMPDNIKIIFGETYSLLSIAYAAIVTSGTATLETALFSVPQVVVYHMGFGKIPNWIFSHLMHVKYISLVNLILDKLSIKEFMGADCTVESVEKEFVPLLSDTEKRREILSDYDRMKSILGTPGASQRTAERIFKSLSRNL